MGIEIKVDQYWRRRRDGTIFQITERLDRPSQVSFYRLVELLGPEAELRLHTELALEHCFRHVTEMEVIAWAAK